MGKNQVRALIIGANASQGMYGNSLLSASTETHVTFYDRRKVELKRQFTHLVKGVQQGRAIFVDTFPSKQYFDVVVVAVSAEQHVPALRKALDELPEPPRLFVLEKPLGVSSGDLRWYQSVSDQLQSCTVVNEPYYFLCSER